MFPTSDYPLYIILVQLAVGITPDVKGGDILVDYFPKPSIAIPYPRGHLPFLFPFGAPHRNEFVDIFAQPTPEILLVFPSSVVSPQLTGYGCVAPTDIAR
jgi:hypothetical protein